MSRLLLFVSVAALSGAAIAVSGSLGAHSATGVGAERAAPIPLFTFGRERGTILPYQVVIASNGDVSVTGTVRRTAQVTVSEPTRAALLKLASAERFFAMPALTRCKTPVGGLATNYIQIRRGTTTTSVGDYGGCNRGFVELFAVLKAVAGIA
jgi:hypothetical protein